MPRERRNAPVNTVFHVTVRGNNKRVLFRRDNEYRYFIKLLVRYKKKHKFLLYHYCLMKNHVHLMIKSTVHTNLSKLMQGIELAYGHYMKKRHGCIGHMWQDRFNSKIIKTDEYLLMAGLYIENNPVRAKIVFNAADYKWSSAKFYALGEKNDLINMDPKYKDMGNEKTRKEKYAALLKSRIYDK